MNMRTKPRANNLMEPLECVWEDTQYQKLFSRLK